MKRNSLISVACILTAACAAVQARGLEVRPADREFFEAEPRQIITTSFRVTNNSGRQQELVSEVELPQGWVLTTDDFPFDLAANESRTKLIGFFIPETTQPGTYKITYIVRSRKYPSVRDFYTIDIALLPHRSLEVKLLSVPKFAMAGENYQTAFQVGNKGNTSEEISLQINSSENVRTFIEPETLNLAPGQSSKVTVTASPDTKISQILQSRLELTAYITGTDKPKVSAEAACSTQIIPLPRQGGAQLNDAAIETILAMINSEKKSDANAILPGNLFAYHQKESLSVSAQDRKKTGVLAKKKRVLKIQV